LNIHQQSSISISSKYLELKIFQKVTISGLISIRTESLHAVARVVRPCWLSIGILNQKCKFFAPTHKRHTQERGISKTLALLYFLVLQNVLLNRSERFLKILVSIHFDFVRVWMQIVFLFNLKSYSLKWKAAIKLWFCLPRSLPCFKIFIMEEFWCNALLLFS